MSVTFVTKLKTALYVTSWIVLCILLVVNIAYYILSPVNTLRSTRFMASVLLLDDFPITKIEASVNDGKYVELVSSKVDGITVFSTWDLMLGGPPGQGNHDILNIRYTDENRIIEKKFPVKGSHPLYAGDCHYYFTLRATGDMYRSECLGIKGDSI